MSSKKKKAKTRGVAVAPKTPKASQPRESTQGDTPHFCFRYTDRNSADDWAFNPGGDDASELMMFLCEMARLTWREIEAQRAGGHKKHHDQQISSTESAAQAHIEKHKLSEVFGDTIFRFRLSGEKRLWGFRNGRVFHILWWDPTHQVYPLER